MTLRSAAAGLFVALAAFCGAPGLAEAACSFTRVAELPITMNGLRPIVHAKVNGQDADFLLDTGAFYSMISPAAAARLKLSMGPAARGFVVQGVGGETNVRIGTAREITFAGAPVKGMKFIVGGPELDSGAVGLIGQNFLKNADVEYDLANGVVRLFVAKDCAGVGLGYWKGVSANAMPMERAEELDPHINGKAAVNGRVIKVTFDTGASTSILTLEAAQRIGLQMKGPGVEAGGIGSGIGRGLVESWIVPVTSFEIGGEQIQRTHLRVGKTRMMDSDMLLGADFFLSHRVMVANSQRRIYFTYNGGPVFSLGRPGAGSAAPQDGPAAADDGKISTDALGRRAAASRARHDYPAAITDLSRALKLEPENAHLLAARAQARLYSGDPKGARADLDAALKMNPTDEESLINRGYLRLKEGDIEGGKADLAAALSAEPDDLVTTQQVATVYQRTRRYDAAVAVLDRWIDGHPKDGHLWEALNSRCWTRSLWNHDLDKALDDCEQAVKRGQRNSMALDSRGMVRLRLGQYQLAVADYDAAIKQQSQSAWSYIGRGIAKEKLGDKAGAQADFKQGLALAPRAAARARNAGLDSDLLPKADGKDEPDAE